MEPSTIIGLIAALLGGGGLGVVLYVRQQRAKLGAEAHKAEAEADGIEARTLTDLWAHVRQLMNEMRTLEARVTALECENRGLRQTVDRFRALVRELWGLIRENDLDLDIDTDLKEAVSEALEDVA